MLENIDLRRKLSKEEHKATKGDMELRLGALQREVRDRKIPVIIVFEGWDAAGKGTLINRLIQPLDPRGFTVVSTKPPNEEEAMRPPLWRYWCRTPARGRMEIFDRAWYRYLVNDRVEGRLSRNGIQRAYEDIVCFERQLADDGNVIIKFFLHISKSEQKRRFKDLRRDPVTAWRVTDEDVARHKLYEQYLAANEEALAHTETEFAPWTIVEATDERFADAKIFATVIHALENRLAQLAAQAAHPPAPASVELPANLNLSILDRVDLSVTVAKEEYKRQLKEKQERLFELEHEIYVHRVPVVMLFEGWDAAGKGGCIRRVTQHLDPRGYEVVPIAAPNDVEKAHHYLWRFWTAMPKAGHITIFDRSWYGRVLVERVEGFCSEADWKRAYREINEMEAHLCTFGVVLLKFWLHLDQDEQLRRFKARQDTPHKTWKITEEDWRNRAKWPVYKTAVEEMLFRTSSPHAPWTIIESNNQEYGRLKVLDTIIHALESRLRPAKHAAKYAALAAAPKKDKAKDKAKGKEKGEAKAKAKEKGDVKLQAKSAAKVTGETKPTAKRKATPAARAAK